MSEVVDLSNVPDLEGRRRVRAALDKFNEIEERRSGATKHLWEKRRALEKIMRLIDSEMAKIDETFDHEKIADYPGIDSPYQMHDDHLGCYCCEISGLPLRDDDETVEWGDGEALACLADQVST